MDPIIETIKYGLSISILGIAILLVFGDPTWVSFCVIFTAVVTLRYITSDRRKQDGRD